MQLVVEVFRCGRSAQQYGGFRRGLTWCDCTTFAPLLTCDVLAVMLEELQQSRTTIAGALVPYTIDVVSVIIKITADPTVSDINCIAEAAVTFVVLLPNSKVRPPHY